MQVKKFEAPTIQEALENVKRELGPEAIILQTKQNKRGFGLMSRASVEVTAAVSERAIQKKNVLENRMPEKSRALMNSMPAGKQAKLIDDYMDKQVESAKKIRENVELAQQKKKLTATRYIDIPDEQSLIQKEMSSQQSVERGATVATQTADPSMTPPKKTSSITQLSVESQVSLEEEIRNLKKVVDELKKNPTVQMNLQSTALDVPCIQDAFEQLVANGVDRRHILPLLKKVAFELGPDRSQNSDQILDLLASEMMEMVEVSDPFAGVKPKDIHDSRPPILIALVGSTGVGKTTTVAKIASDLIHQRNLRVGLINLDSYKINAFEQLGTYAKILNVPFRSATTLDDFQSGLLDFQNLDVVLVDTAGRSHKDPDSLQEMQALLKAIPELRTFLVLSATTRDLDLYQATNRFSMFRPQGLIISKLDEASVYGGLYNLSQKAKLPFFYFTTGQKIPNDIEIATKERLVSLVMEI